MATIVLWVYIALLLVGGLIGFLKAGSKVSLITSAIFAVALVFFALGMVPWTVGADVILGLLIVVFAIRLAKTKKFMPSGMMLAVTIVALVLHLLGSQV